MKRLATLDTEPAAKLVEYLASLHITSSTQSSTEESGLICSELWVEDANYDQACEAAEAWAEREADASARQAKRICPKCRSPHLDYVEHPRLGLVYRCRDCGTVVVR